MLQKLALAEGASRNDTSVSGIIARARNAQRLYEAEGDQRLFDRMSQAAAWALMQPERNRELSSIAVEHTELGNIEDKVTKNHRKTLGLLQDLQGVSTYGLSYENEKTGIAEFLRPKGVVAALVPSTNPLATPTNNIVNALKTANAIIIAPSPKGARVLQKLLAFIHAELEKTLLACGYDEKKIVASELVQMLPLPPSKPQTAELMAQADFIVATGSQNNVRAAYKAGTPAIGVGVGNAVVIVDDSADINDAVSKIAASKVFDNATSCSSENALIVIDSVYDEFINCLHKHGGMLLDEQQTQKLVETHWLDGKIQPAMLGKGIDEIVAQLNLKALPATKFLVAPRKQFSTDDVLVGEKMARFLTLYRAQNFAEAQELATKILNFQGTGHSIGIHTLKYARAHELAMTVPACRVIVNQAHCFATGGSFENSLPFSLSMGCGSWGGNTIDENLHWRHFVNRVRVVRPLASREPSIESIFGEYWSEVGR